MIKTLFYTCTGFLTFLSARAGDGEYSIVNIPAGMKEHAHIVKRKEEIRFELENPGLATEYHKVAITVLDENGDRYAMLEETYDKLSTIESIGGTLFDAQGKKVKSLRKSDVEDHSATEDINLTDDYRLKYHNFYCKNYPYTVEYEWITQSRNTMFFPAWEPMDEFNESVQESRMEVVCPDSYTLRFRATHFSGDPQITKVKSKTTYTWSVANLPAITRQYDLPPWRDLVPMVHLGPSLFEVEGYKGNMQTWEDYGKFIYALKQGRDQLPPDIRARVHEMTDALQDPKDKIARLYEFMQQNTRYISIQLGIGGWQPFDAKYVAAKKYGDCKALSNYMYALLKEAGIESYYTLIFAGGHRQYFLADFPSSQFNHVILCVPTKKDTVWLECTRQSMPVGYLGSFTADRPALLIDEKGGKLVHTPKYTYTDNRKLTLLSATINEEGNLEADVHNQYRAVEQEPVEFLINDYSKDQVRQYLKTYIDLPTYDVLRFEYKQEKSAMPVIHETLKLVAPNYSQVTSKRFFVNPNVLNRWDKRIEKEEDRTFDIMIYDESTYIDSVTIQIPQGYVPESIPENKILDTEFGKYTRKTRVEGSKISYYRELIQFAGRFPGKDYPGLVDFYDQLFKADQSQAVFVKSN